VKTIPAFIQILDKAGVNYGAPGEDESCCGYLSYLVGDMPTFDKAMQMHNERVEKYKAKELITTCAGCLKTFRDLYPHYGSKNHATVLHAVELMEKLIADGKLKFKEDSAPVKVAYHDPCDMGRHMGIYEPPRKEYCHTSRSDPRFSILRIFLMSHMEPKANLCKQYSCRRHRQRKQTLLHFHGLLAVSEEQTANQCSGQQVTLPAPGKLPQVRHYCMEGIPSQTLILS